MCKQNSDLLFCNSTGNNSHTLTKFASKLQNHTKWREIQYFPIIIHQWIDTSSKITENIKIEFTKECTHYPNRSGPTT